MLGETGVGVVADAGATKREVTGVADGAGARVGVEATLVTGDADAGGASVASSPPHAIKMPSATANPIGASRAPHIPNTRPVIPCPRQPEVHSNVRLGCLRRPHSLAADAFKYK